MPGISVSKICIPFGGVGAGFSFTPAQAPSGLTLTVLSDTSIRLNWTDNSTIEDGFSIERSPDNATWAVINTPAANAVTYTNTGLTAGTLYYFQLRAYKGAVYSAYTAVISATTWSAGEAVIRAGNTVAWYDSQDLTTLTKDTGGTELVSRWNDKLLSGHDLIQANGALQPLYQVTGIRFPGVDEFMQSTFALVQPYLYYMVLNQVTWTSGDRILDGVTAVTVLYQYSATPIVALYAGTGNVSNNNFAVNTLSVVRCLFSGASSFIQINNSAAVVANAGSSDPGGITIGGTAAGANNSDILVAEIVVRNVADNAATQKSIYNYLAAKNGLPTI